MKIKKPPYRTWIGVMVFMTTAVNYNYRTFFPVTLIAMLDRPITEKLSNGTEVSKPPPDYGPRYSWTPLQEGQLIGGYFYGYTIGSLIGGPITEYIGPYWTVISSTVVSCVITCLSVTVVMESWVPLFITRILVGLIGGWQYPSLQCLIGRWAPPDEKGKFVACLMGNVLGSVITQIYTGAVVSSLGWMWGFFFTAIFTVIYLIIWVLVVADFPERSWFCSKEEIEYILETHQGSVKSGKNNPF